MFLLPGLKNIIIIKKKKSLPCIYVSKVQGLGKKRTQAIEKSWRKPHLYEQGLCHSFNLKNNSNEKSSSETEKVREEEWSVDVTMPRS